MKERRKFPRVSLESLENDIAGDKNKEADCKVTEISREGIRLHTKKEVVCGQCLNLKINIPSSSKPEDSIITLKWTKKVHDETGFEFQAGGELKISDPEARQSLMDWLSKCTNI
jgi:hypothetical protein